VAADVTIASVTGAVGSVTGAVGSVTGNVGGNVTGSVGSVVGAVGSVTGAVGSVTGTVGGIAGTTQTLDALQTAQNSAHGAGSWATAAGFSTHAAADVWAVGTRTLTSFGTLVADAAAAVWAAVTRTLSAGTNIVLAKGTGVTGFNDLDASGVRSAVGMASANLDTQIGTLATAATLATVAGYVDTEVAAIKAKTDNLPASPAAVGSAMTLTSAYDFSKGTVAMTEGYAAEGAAMTPAQALHMVWSMLNTKEIAATTLTTRKLDGTTAAMTFTLDSATTPTAQTRAT
jgi:hypothetical protein